MCLDRERGRKRANTMVERHFSSSGWRPSVCGIIHSQLPHNATAIVLRMSKNLFIKVALVCLLGVVD